MQESPDLNPDWFGEILIFTQNNLEYLIQNAIHLVIQIYHSMLVQIL